MAGISLTAAEVLIFFVSVYYFTLDVRLAIGMFIATVLIDFAAFAIGDWKIGLAAFVIGWIFQGVGHAVYEKRSPAFTKNLLHLLVGPIFLVNEAFHFRQVKGPQGTARRPVRIRDRRRHALIHISYPSSLAQSPTQFDFHSCALQQSLLASPAFIS